MKKHRNKAAGERFEPENDGQGKVHAPVKAKHVPRKVGGNTALGDALLQALRARENSQPHE